jgi:hypothetical protein
MSRHDFPRLFHALKPLSNRGISPISRRNGRRGFLGIKNPRFVVISSAGARLGWAMPPAQPMGAAAASSFVSARCARKATVCAFRKVSLRYVIDLSWRYF